jgi:hypothetical protein
MNRQARRRAAQDAAAIAYLRTRVKDYPVLGVLLKQAYTTKEKTK